MSFVRQLQTSNGFIALVMIALGQGGTAPSLAGTCAKVLVAPRLSVDGGGKEGIVSVYRRLISTLSFGEQQLAALMQMQRSGSPFHLPEGGPSERSSLRNGLRQLRLYAERRGLDMGELEAALSECLRGEIEARTESENRSQSAVKKAGKLRLEYLIGHNTPVGALAFSRDGITLASSVTTSEVFVWNSKTGGHRWLDRNLRFSAHVDSMGFSEDGEWLAVSGFNLPFQLIHVRTLESKHDLNVADFGIGMTGNYYSNASAVAFSPRLDAVAGQWGGEFRIRELSSGKTIVLRSWDRRFSILRIFHPFFKSQNEPNLQLFDPAIAFSPDGEIIAFAGDTTKPQLWRWRNKEFLFTLPLGPPECKTLAFSPDGQLLATGGHEIRLWNPSDGSLSLELSPTVPNPSGFNKLVFSPDSRILFAKTGDGKIEVFDLGKRTSLGSVEEQRAMILSMAYSSKEKILATGDDSNRIHLWEMEEIIRD